MGARFDALLERLTLRRLIAVFAIFACFIGLVGVVGFQRLANEATTLEQHRLKSLAEMKANQVSEWVNERRTDLYANARNDVFRELLVTSRTPDTNRWQDRFAALYSDQRVSRWLEDTRAMYGYRSSEVLNHEGEAIISVGAAPYTDKEIRPLLGQALATDSAVLLDMRLDREGTPYMAFGAHIPDEATDVPLILVYSLATTERFFPMLDEWPNPSKTGELLLYRINGQEVSLLNRMQNHKRDFVHFSTEAPDQPIKKALVSGPGVYSGVDFRGQAVLAAIQPVPGTPWWISAKINESELYSPIRELAWICGLLVLAGVVVAGFLLSLLWQQQQRRFAVAQSLGEQLRLASEQAQLANHSKSLFLANMSHEIRTPLNAVIGFSQLALKTSLTPKQRDYITKIGSEGGALLSIINDILDFSKIEAGKMDLELIPFRLDDLLDDLTALLAPRAQSKGLELQVHIAPEVPLGLLGDPLRLRQVLLNLLTNAIKFTEHGQVLLSVSHSAVEDDWLELHIAVEDTGIGLSEAQRARLFTSFTQADSSTTRKYGGTGLGLVISQRIAQLMQGAITVQSSLGEGSTFTCHVRLRTAQAERNLPSLEPLAGAAEPNLNMHVLLVEDNEINQQIAVETLSGMGVQTTVVNHGKAALELLLATPDPLPWCMVFMDLQMPVMDGHQATIEIRKLERFNSLPIVAMTAHAMREEGQRCLDEGMNEHLTKPIVPQALLASLQRWGTPRTDAHETTRAPAADTDSADEMAHQSWRNIPGIDSADGLRNCANKTSLYTSLLLKYATTLPLAAQELHQACEQRDWETGRRVIHTLKGTSLNLGANACGQMCLQAEKALRDQFDPELWRARSDELCEAFITLSEVIARHLSHASEEPQPASPEAPQPIASQAPSTDLVLVQLRMLLQSNSVEAEAFCQSNSHALRGVLGEQFDALCTLVRDFEFEQALALLP
jgi:signal transduction histidine kinase/CheY-like chemotaxis protein/HPt (histidine-containing phosphotransfer) domain-containing protein